MDQLQLELERPSQWDEEETEPLNPVTVIDLVPDDCPRCGLSPETCPGCDF